MSKHTEEEWKSEDETVYALDERGENVFFAHVQAGFRGKTGSKVAARTLKSELQANAKLIRAAPEMLEMLKEARQLLNDANWRGDFQEEIDALITEIESE